MDKIEILNKIKLKKHAISLEKESNELANLQNDLKILELRLQINYYREKIKKLIDEKF